MDRGRVGASVCELVLQHLPHYPFERTALRFLSADMLEQATTRMQPSVRLPKLLR